MTPVKLPNIDVPFVEPGTWNIQRIWWKFLEKITNRLNTPQSTGWTAGTGTANKGAFVVHTGQTISNPPTQAEVQAVDLAVQKNSQRIKALEDALRENGWID